MHNFPVGGATGVLYARRSTDGIFSSGRTESVYSVPDRRIVDYEETSWQGRALENFSETGSGRSLFSASNIWHRAKKIPEAANPRGAEDSSYFRGRLARNVARAKFFSVLGADRRTVRRLPKRVNMIPERQGLQLRAVNSLLLRTCVFTAESAGR